jgi:hypothetical protein
MRSSFDGLLLSFLRLVSLRLCIGFFRLFGPLPYEAQEDGFYRPAAHAHPVAALSIFPFPSFPAGLFSLTHRKSSAGPGFIGPLQPGQVKSRARISVFMTG